MPEVGRAVARPVRLFRQTLLWPVQLMPIREEAQIQRHWELLQQPSADNPWREVAEEFAGVPQTSGVRQYAEFISFLPHVQRFLYGDPRAGGSRRSGSSMRVFRRSDVAAVRIVLRRGAAPLTLQVLHTDLYFFYDLDIVLLNVEVSSENLSLFEAQDLLYRFGRAYPSRWEANGDGLHCAHRVEWLDAEARVLSTSDYENRERFVSFVRHNRAADISAHWAFLLSPLALDASDRAGPIRFRQLEYHRMPLMCYLAVDDPLSLSRADLVRLGLVTEAGADDVLPYSERHVADFEHNFCYDRYWDRGAGAPNTRFMCNGHALVTVGDAQAGLFTDPEVGVLAEFQHRHFLLFLIAHMQRAGLLMFSDRLVEALDQLDISDAESVKRFKRIIRRYFEIFLRFTHRYGFHDLSDQAQVKALFQMCTRHLGTERLYAEVKQEIYDMSAYLDSDSLRRQANTVLRLTVVTTFGLIGTVVTGFLGMNLLALADRSLWLRILYFVAVMVPTTWLTIYTIVKSKRLSDFLEALSDERLTMRAKLDALLNVWRRPGAARRRQLPDESADGTNLLR